MCNNYLCFFVQPSKKSKKGKDKDKKNKKRKGVKGLNMDESTAIRKIKEKKITEKAVEGANKQKADQKLECDGSHSSGSGDDCDSNFESDSKANVSLV